MTPTERLAHYDAATLWPDYHPRPGPGDVAAAYCDALALRALREARGENVVGYKIGFTNRSLWPRLGVSAPIWGPVWDSTLLRCDGQATLALDAISQPRLEPELVFGIAATPPADLSLEALFGCIDWMAPGFEVVQSHSPDWKSNAAEIVADGAVHARLVLGPARPARELAGNGAALDTLLAAVRMKLFRGDALTDQGTGANVLDGPLQAFAQFVREVQACPRAPALRPGDVVTTGAWTDPWPVAPGETWRAEFGAPLSFSLEVAFRAAA
jgi:2-oxo-3-hexenedioate decarboxylase